MVFLIIMLVVDWLSLVKAKFILAFISKQTNIIWIFSFVLIDILSTLIIFIFGFGLFLVIIIAMSRHYDLLNPSALPHVMLGFLFVIGVAVRAYFIGQLSSFFQVAVASTMLTSA
jgi:hypothetical protein